MPTSSANLGYGSNKLWNWIFVALPGEFACKRGQATAYQKKREKKKILIWYLILVREILPPLTLQKQCKLPPCILSGKTDTQNSINDHLPVFGQKNTRFKFA